MPPPIRTDGAADGYHIITIEEKVISDYINIPLTQVDELDCFEYWLLLRDAVIYYHGQSEKGQELLLQAWQSEQTKPDKKRLKEVIGMQKI